MVTLTPDLPVVFWITTGWLLLGLLSAALLATRGVDEGTAAMALLAWPFLLPILLAPPPNPGPLRERIDGTLRDLHRSVDDPLARSSLSQLREALIAADGRVARVDGLLATRFQPALAQAREQTVDGLKQVLDKLDQVHLEAELHALRGDRLAEGPAIADLLARVRAIGEVRGLGG